MTIPLSINRAKAMVPIKERIPIKRITSKKAVVLRNTEKMATAAIILMPRASRA